MKYCLLLVFVTLMKMYATAQAGKTISIPVSFFNGQADTSLWYLGKQALAKQLLLPNLQLSTDTFYFRFWTNYQCVDIWTTDHIHYNGQVTNYAQRYDRKLFRKGVSKVDSLFSKKINMDSSTARQIFKLIDSLNIAAIPSDEKIKGWQQGLDGMEYCIEIATSTQYEFKNYWSPVLFVDEVYEAKQIQYLIDQLDTKFKIYRYYKQLKLPKGIYKHDGLSGISITPSVNEPGIKNSLADWF